MSSLERFRSDMKRAISRRRLHARINAMPPSTVRDELVAIARRYENNNH
jgi:hypothetical protein